MADEPNADSGSTPAQPLEYRGPASVSEDAFRLGTAISGFLAGVIAISSAGVIPYLSYFLDPNGMPLRLRWGLVALSAAIVIGAVASLLRLRRGGSWRGRASFWIGVLLGVGVAALVEGVCFGVLPPS